MRNEQASKIFQAPGMETNQGEMARPPIVIFSIENSEFFSETRKPSSTTRNVVTEEPSSAGSQILPPKRAEVFVSP